MFSEKKFFNKKSPTKRLFWFLALIAIILAINLFYGDVFSNRNLVIFDIGTLFILLIISIISNFNLGKSYFCTQNNGRNLEYIIHNLPIGVIIYDKNLKVELFNRSAEKILKIPAKKIVGKKLDHKTLEGYNFKIFHQIVSTKGQSFNLQFKDPKINLRIATDQIISPDKTNNLFVRFITDQTNNLDLQESQKNAIALIAHQLRTPLTAIHWSFESLRKEILTKNQKGIVDTGLESSGQLLKTVNEFLDSLKIEDGRVNYHFNKENVVQLINGVISGMINISSRLRVNIRFNKPNWPVSAYIDAQKIAMVLFNLLDNAIRYNIENGEVMVFVEKLKNRPFIKVIVKDTGIGIPHDQINNLFNKFFRADNAKKFITEGTGLGLYIAKNIIRAHGGEIWVESKFRQGATFYFTLPTEPDLIPKNFQSQN